ncbi:MAG: response regulator [Bacteroidetes bacterium]|nr:response regulator [Bacteroidota bacterium]
MSSSLVTPAQPRPTSLRVLVADDDADMRLYLTGCLHGFGLSGLVITEATDGREALRLARVLKPAFIISDLLMPGLDGVAFCHALRADPRTAAIPFLLISGVTRAPPPCADGFLEKPFDAAGLRVHVERLLPRPA